MSQTAIRQGFLQRKMLQFRVKIQLEIFVEIFSVMGADLTKNTTWISNCHHVRGDILGDHGACADHAVVTDGDAGHDLNARADPNISPHADGQIIHIPQFPQAGVDRVPGCGKYRAGTDHAVISDINVGIIDKGHHCVTVDVSAKMNVTQSPIGMDRRVNGAVFTHLCHQCRQHSAACLMLGRKRPIVLS